MTTVWVPCDAAARAVGADEVAEAFAAAGATVRRNGSRGMLWLEPLVEVETDAGRIGYAAARPQYAGDILAGNHVDLGVVLGRRRLADQHRVTFTRVGRHEPTDLAAYRSDGGYAGLERALTLDPADVVAEVTTSGLRGRGGAGFPTGIKWETVRKAASDLKFVCCNADEGDSGTFADRMLLEGDPFSLLEGMAIAAYRGRERRLCLRRSEYPDAIATLPGHRCGPGRRLVRAASPAARASPSTHVRVGAGAYIWRETSMPTARGKARRGARQTPIPALVGLASRPSSTTSCRSRPSR